MSLGGSLFVGHPLVGPPSGFSNASLKLQLQQAWSQEGFNKRHARPQTLSPRSTNVASVAVGNKSEEMKQTQRERLNPRISKP